MSDKYALVKRYFDVKAWNLDRVKQAVKKNWITAEEYRTITGEAYE